MISKDLLAILVCPDDHTPLALADENLLAEVNRGIAAGQVVNQAGDPVAGRLEGGLVRQDRSRLYPIVDGIPILLVDEAIPLGELAKKQSHA